MTDQSFFDESRQQSQIKARIVSKYFWAWAKVIIPIARRGGGRIAYVDLFAGPGRYKDGTLSTPLLVLQRAVSDLDMREMLITIFNDCEENNAAALEKAIADLPGTSMLRHKPQISSAEVGDEIVELFNRINMIPTFFFVDPWGYKGLSLGLINSVLKNWGCDCIFFFNYNRVNMGLSNPIVDEHMNVLFGNARAHRLRARLEKLRPGERESLIIEELSEALKDMGATYVLPFTFRNETGTRTTHHLIFASKNFTGYAIMKEIMARESSERTQGVPSFEYSPASEKFPLLFELTRPLDDLQQMLLNTFAGQRLTMQGIYMRHNIGRPYVKANYKDALSQLERAGKIKAEPPADKRPKKKGETTFADHVLVTFSSRGD